MIAKKQRKTRAALPLARHPERQNNRKELIPLAELNGQILVDERTGQIYLTAASIKLEFPTLVIRHGQTDANLRQVLHGQVDGPENQLNEKGREEARLAAEGILEELLERPGQIKLAELVKSGSIRILTSPILRARHTAECFSGVLQTRVGYEVEIEEEETLKELSFGTYDGCALDEIDDKDYAELVGRYRTLQDATIDWLGTGESFIAAVIRARGLIERLNTTCRNRLIIVFSHGTFISALRAALGDKSLVSETGMILFRDRLIKHTTPYWLPGSVPLLNELLEMGIR